MAQETKVEETRCSLQTFERNRYFYGKPMTVSDFEAEQRYLVGKQRYVNRLVHGAGVLCGLQVTAPAAFSAESPTVELAEGAALDCCGNLIIVSRSGTAEVKGDFDPSGPNYLYLKYAECSKQPVMLAANGSSCEEVCCYNRIQETFEVVASRTAPGGKESAAAKAKAPAANANEPPPDPEAVCRALTENYYQEKLRTCPGCDDPLVFLAVLNAATGEVDKAETAKYRSVVFNNTMLHELLCGHVTDYDNPHRTSAEQVRALQSVNGVGNGPTRTFVPNIDLQSPDGTVGVTPNVNVSKIELVLAAGAVKTPHLNEGIVGRKHLDEDFYANLVQGGGIVKVKGEAATRTVNVSAEVTINDRKPNESGEFILTPGANVSIHKGVADNELVISAEGVGKAEVATGFFIFENVLPQEGRQSTLIAHRLESDLVAVVVALEESEVLRNAAGVRLNDVNTNAKFGDLTAFDREAPSLMAEVDYNQRTIQLRLKDNRQDTRNAVVKPTDEGGVTSARAGETAPSGALTTSGTGDGIIFDPNARTYRVRWWAIPT